MDQTGPLPDDNEIKAYLEDVELFIGLLREDPSVLHSSDLKFFADYIRDLGGKIPPLKEDDHVFEEVNDNGDGMDTDTPAQASGEPTRGAGAQEADEMHVDKSSEQEEEEEEEEEDDEEEETDSEVMEPDTEPFPDMPLPDFQPSENDMEASMEKKMAANEAKSNAEYAKAIELYTEVLMLNPSPLVHANRAECLLKQSPPRPVAAIRDADAALKVNPDSAKAMKMRGRANRMLGNWEAAAKDLHTALQVDFDEDTEELRKLVDEHWQRIEQRKRRKEQRKMEKDREKKLKKAKEAAAARKRAQESARQTSSAFPGGMPNFGGGAGIPPEMLNEMMSDPDLVKAMQNPKIMKAMQEVTQDPSKLESYLNDPEIKSFYEKAQSLFGTAGENFGSGSASTSTAQGTTTGGGAQGSPGNNGESGGGAGMEGVDVD